MSRNEFIDCDCCFHTTPCNSVPVLASLPLQLRFGAFSTVVSLRWSGTACGSGTAEGWHYGDGTSAFDILICTGFYLREVNLCCVGGSWALEVVLVNNGVQDFLSNPGSFQNLTTVNPNPMHLATRTNGEYSSPCGFEFIYIDIGTFNLIVPNCCSKSGTLTLYYKIGGLDPDTLSVTQIGSSPITFFGETEIGCGDGHTTVPISFFLTCISNQWFVDFFYVRSVDGVSDPTPMEWSYNYLAGNTYSAFQLSCNPFHMRFSVASQTSGPAATGNISCGALTFPYHDVAHGGAVPLELDLIAP